MTDLYRGARTRRGGRRPGWMLLTVLLVLAICASSALVFTNRTELLKLAVILSVWAAVAAAFVSVIYRRQSDVDAAKARDLKLVYDLQLDREISARREYELTLEAQLRRELASEAQAQAADEVAALRAELAALRTNLEILFDTELVSRPAIETERPPVRAYSDWARDDDTTVTPRVPSTYDDMEAGTDESPIIDVPEEPEPPPDLSDPAGGGAHRRDAERPHTAPPPGYAAYQRPAAPPPQPGPAVADDWRPAPAEGQWLPPGTPGSNWVAAPEEAPAPPPAPAPPAPERRQRHYGDDRPTPWRSTSADPFAPQEPGPPAEPQPAPEAPAAGPRRGRHWTPDSPAPEDAAADSPPPPPSPPQPPPRRHRNPDDEADSGEHTGGQSVAELLARLGAATGGGGRRRRRDD
ncbi:hypothetical protein LV457_04000 [Mycobacterium sp. MYCO198283]|uniref:DUF6779 domain-containing protein n=1 Tax=Mycobacterium sp. MYCO198283 TaxID=2883505 RepID=UPI001E416769|nr:DUF6779 domain-containing protein [Mycobacterium sp. MYCO198283]MCG5431453.1 hypothetical protein [Mycobacterium sp. MYCO198283]